MWWNNSNKNYRINNPYLDISDDARIRCFRSEYWNNLDDEQKMYLIQATGDQYAKEMGINNPPLFAVESDSSLCGSYSDYNNRITINLSTCNNPYEALNTIAHEENHAYQTQAIIEGSNKYSDDELALLNAEKKAYENSGIAYSRQTLECDSNIAGAEYVLNHKEVYADDLAYAEYTERTLSQIRASAEDYRNNRTASDNSEINQIERAERSGKINQEEAEAARRCLEDNNNSVKAEMLLLEGELITENARIQQTEYNISTSHDTESREAYDADELKELRDKQKKLDIEYEEKMQQLSEYINERNMDIPQAHRDEYVIAVSNELRDLEQQKSDIKYEISKIETDEELKSQKEKDNFLDINDDYEPTYYKDNDGNDLDILDIKQDEHEEIHTEEKITSIEFEVNIDAQSAEEVDKAEYMLENEFAEMNAEGIYISDNSKAVEENYLMIDEAATEIENTTDGTEIEVEVLDYETSTVEISDDNEESEERWMIY